MHANHIANTIETDPQAGWIFIVDQLNTHKEASRRALGGGLLSRSLCLKIRRGLVLSYLSVPKNRRGVEAPALFFLANSSPRHRLGSEGKVRHPGVDGNSGSFSE